MTIYLGNHRCFEPEFYSMVCIGARRCNLVVSTQQDKGDVQCIILFNGLSLDSQTLNFAGNTCPNGIFFERNPFYVEGDDPPNLFQEIYRICVSSLSYRLSFPYCFPTKHGRFRKLQEQHSLRQIVPWDSSRDQGKIYIFANYNEGFWTGIHTKKKMEESISHPETVWANSLIRLVNIAICHSDKEIVIKFHPLTRRDRADYRHVFRTLHTNSRITLLHGQLPLTELAKDMYCALMENGSSCIPLLLLGVPTVNPRDDLSHTWYSHFCVSDIRALGSYEQLYSLVPDQEEALDFVASQCRSRNEIKETFFSEIVSHLASYGK